MFLSLILSACLISEGSPAGMEIPATDSLHAVTVTADRGVVVSRKDTLSFSNSFTISDALQLSPGLLVGDNGGSAGLKTVSLRGMGSAHTAIYVDGVRVGNVQSGQTDLGALGIENFSSAVIDYAQNSVSFNTLRPVFGMAPVSASASFYAGSFGTYMPKIRLDFRLNERLSLSANVSGSFSKGDFPYADTLRRANNDLRQIRAGMDLFGTITGGDFHVKAYYSDADRGTPGSTSYPSTDRQKDRNAFIQGVLSKKLSGFYTLKLSAKGSYDDIQYFSSWGDSRYGQTELQLNSAHDFRLTDWCRLSLAADLQWDGLKSTGYDASRFSVLGALASSFRFQRFSANVAFEYLGAFDQDALSRGAFSPSLDLKYTIFKGFDITAFGRRAYRIPTFNELYYAGYGNPDLRPEDAWMMDIGLDFNRTLSSKWTINAKLDGFCNLLKDKIISAPTEADPNIWLPYNIGRVRALGADVVLGADFRSGDWTLSLDAKYTWQSAKDVTPDSYSYGSAVPYIAKHTMVLNGLLSWKGWSLSPLWHLRSGRSDGYGEMPDWNTFDVTLAKAFALGRAGSLGVRLSARNIFDCRYEVVGGYPMPGRNFLAGIEYKF
ncbi:MAG: TonB-dependent receptor [Bacteroidales bacterium]|nr:TonB-dependent receptor [Bacteroidales bacterium]